MQLPLSDKPHPGTEYTSIDQALGASSRRFFGSGYRKVHHQLRILGFETTADGVWHACGKASVCYPSDWSKKSTASALRPHLSSIDAVSLAARLAEQGLARTLSLDQEQCRRMWIRSITFRAGAEPLMDLADFDVNATAIRSASELFSLCGHVSFVECRIGPVKVTLEIEHEPARLGVPQGDKPAIKTSEGFTSGYFDGGYKDTSCEIGPISADLQAQAVTALVQVSEPVTHLRQEGIGAAYHPCFTIIEGIVVMAQLAQVLAYATDNLRRDQSNTLWLRNFSCSLRTPYQSIVTPFIATLSTSKSRIISLASTQWRTMNLEGNAIGLTGSFSVAHQLPQDRSS
jgi:hypothetical protein